MNSVSSSFTCKINFPLFCYLHAEVLAMNFNSRVELNELTAVFSFTDLTGVGRPAPCSRFKIRQRFHRFAAIAACNPPDIKCINAFREKAKLYFVRNTENRADYFSRCVNHSIDVEFGRRSFQFAILRSSNFSRHSNLKVQSLALINPIPLLYKNILTRITLVF